MVAPDTVSADPDPTVPAPCAPTRTTPGSTRTVIGKGSASFAAVGFAAGAATHGPHKAAAAHAMDANAGAILRRGKGPGGIMCGRPYLPRRFGSSGSPLGLGAYFFA